MSGYCEGKPPAKIWFKYEGQKWDCFEVGNVPASFELEKILPDSGSNICPRLYFVRVHYELNDGATNITETLEVPGPIRGVEIRRGDGFTVLDLLNYDGEGNPSTFRVASNSFNDLSALLEVLSSTLKPGQPPCEEGEPETECVFKIFDKDNQKLLEKRSPKCPQVKASCGDDCPSQFMRCKSNAYPGYQCKPCSEFRM